MDSMTKAGNITISQITHEEFSLLQKKLKISTPIEQTPLWGAFDKTIKGRTYLGSYSCSLNEEIIGVFSATLYTERGRNWIWIKHGPLLTRELSQNETEKLCTALQRTFKVVDDKIKPMFIRLTLPTKAAQLKAPFEHTMYDQTVVADLTMSEDELFASMSQSGRQGVRKAAKAMVTVREVTQQTAAFFAEHCYPILEETGVRDGFGIHPLATYTSMLDTLSSHAKLFVAEEDGAVGAWAITTEYDGKALYYYGASSHRARQTSAAYALHWEIMKEMKRLGCTEYDFMGIAGKHYPSLKNVTGFKMKFTKNVVSLPITYDLPLRKLGYRALALALRIKRKLHH